MAAATILAASFHTPLLLLGVYRLSYDAYLHMFFADHYLRDWWSLWEPRWYTSFSVASYPPLAHQGMALLARFVGLDVAFGLMLLGGLLLLPMAVHRFAGAFVPPVAAGAAALVAPLVPAVALVSYAFGQLPSLWGMVLGLLWLGWLYRYLVTGHGLALVVLWLAVVTSIHHLTLVLLLPAGGLSVMTKALMDAPTARGRVLQHGGLAFLLGGLAALAVVFPFWAWSRDFVQQAPIDHASRHNFLTSADARDMFLWPLYGPLLPLPLVAVSFALRSRTHFPLALLSAFLALVGLGGTTPLPSLLYGPLWEWLTYDRFSVWASLTVLPVVGLLWMEIKSRAPAKWGRALGAFALMLLATAAVYAATLPLTRIIQPRQLDLAPAARFLDSGERSAWRYITFGLGDQMNKLAFMTDAGSVDGSYHTARKLPELTSSGVGQLDAGLWWDPSGRVLTPFLEHQEHYGLRWAFLNDARYEPFLSRFGWHETATLDDGLRVWEPRMISPPPVLGTAQSAPLESVAWGGLPLLALALALAATWRQARLHGPATSCPDPNEAHTP